MKDHQSSSSSLLPQALQISIPESLKSLNIKPEEKAGTVPSSAVESALALSLRGPQANILGCEKYNLCKRKKPKVQQSYIN